LFYKTLLIKSDFLLHWLGEQIQSHPFKGVLTVFWHYSTKKGHFNLLVNSHQEVPKLPQVKRFKLNPNPKPKYMPDSNCFDQVAKSCFVGNLRSFFEKGLAKFEVKKLEYFSC